MKEPHCYSGNPVLSRLGRYHSYQIFKDIQRCFVKKEIGQEHAMADPSLLLKRQEVMTWRVTLNYVAFWIDGGNIGVMMHPHTHMPIWLNETALHLCRLMDGGRTIADILSGMPCSDQTAKICEKIIGFLLLLEDLDMVTIRRHSND